VRTSYYAVEQWNWFAKLLLGRNEESVLIWEMQTGQGAVEILALAILRSADRARHYYAAMGQTEAVLSAYIIAMGVQAYSDSSDTLYLQKNWTSKGFYHDWVEVIDDAVEVFGLHLSTPDDYLPYTPDERRSLNTLPPGQEAA
jgi:hypothetical protein